MSKIQKRKSISVKPDFYEQVTTYCQLKGRSVSEFVEYAAGLIMRSADQKIKLCGHKIKYGSEVIHCDRVDDDHQICIGLSKQVGRLSWHKIDGKLLSRHLKGSP